MSETEQKQKKPKRKILKRLVVFAVLAFAVLAGLGAGSLVFLESGLFRQLLMERINRMIPGTVVWQSLDLSLREGRVRLENVSLTGPDRTELVRLEQAETRIRWQPLLEGVLSVAYVKTRGLECRMETSASGQLNLVSALVPPDKTDKKEAPPSSGSAALPLEIRVDEVSLDNNQITLKTPEAAVAVSGLDVRIDTIRLAGPADAAGGGTTGEKDGGLPLSVSVGSIHTRIKESRIRTPDRTLTLDPVEIQSALAGDLLSGIRIRAGIPGIQLDIRGRVAHLFGKPEPELTADIDIDSQAAARLLGPDKGVSGSGRIRLTIAGALENPRTGLDLSFGPGRFRDRELKQVRIAARLEDRVLTLLPSSLASDLGTAGIEGTIDLSPMFPHGFIAKPAGSEKVTYQFTLRQQELSLSKLSPDTGQLGGLVSSEIRVTGTGLEPGRIKAGISGDLAAAKLRHPAMKRPADLHCRLAATMDGHGIRLETLTADGPGLALSGRMNLDMPGFDPKTAKIEGNLALDAADPDLIKQLTGMDIRGKGQITAQFRGPAASPEIRASVRTREMSTGLGAPARLRDGTLELDAALDQKGGLDISRFAVTLSGADIRGKGRISLFDPGFRVKPDPALVLDLSLADLDLAGLLPGKEVRGNVSGDVSVSGTLASPVVKAAVNARDLAAGSAAVGDAGADLSLSGNILTIEKASLTHKNAVVDLNGSVDLNPASPDLNLHVKTDRLQVADIYPGGSGSISLDAAVLGSLARPEIRGRMQMDGLALENQPGLKAGAEAEILVQGPFDKIEGIAATLGLSKVALDRDGAAVLRIPEASARLEQGMVTLSDTRIDLAAGGSLNVKGRAGTDQSVDFTATGKIPLAAVAGFVPDIRDPKGEIRIAGAAKGMLPAPEVKGEVAFDGLGMTLAMLEQEVSNLSGRLLVTPESLDIKKISGRLGQGRFDINGAAALSDGKPGTFDLNISADGLELDIPDTLELGLNSRLTFSGTPDKSKLSGDITLLEGRYYKDVAMNLVELAKEKKRAVEPAGSGEGTPFLDTIALEIHVGRRDPLAVENNLAALSISPDLTIRGTALKPSLAGRCQVDEGTITFQNAEFEVTRGIIDFINPYAIDPEVDLAGQTEIRDWTITLSVSGSPRDLSLVLTSDPAESQGDILSLIAFGKTSKEIANAKGAGGAASAEVAAGLLADPLSKNIKDATGLDEVKIKTDDADSSGTPGVQVSLGADLSRQMSVVYGMDVNDGETVQRVTTYYKLLENLMMSGFQDSKGKIGGELKYRLEFR